MPDISLLVEIADFYDVDVREIIEGERKSEMMNKEVREVATKMADYANTEKGRLLKVVRLIGIIGVIKQIPMHTKITVLPHLRTSPFIIIVSRDLTAG